MENKPSPPLETATAAVAVEQDHLAHGLRTRHLTMMGLGSAIGAGLFLGSGVGIATAGPAVLISYAIAGILVIGIMRMLAEMASAMPASGSFSVYAEVALGRWAGFLLGWIYWFMLIMVLGVEITGVSRIINGWLPAVPQWLVALVFVALFAVINLIGVRHFGEMEFWFASIKVIAILGFLVIGALLVFGALPDTNPVGLTNLTGHGGFAPKGIAGIVSGLLVVVFAFGGIEIVTIAAAEARDPQLAVAKSTRSIVWRILVFYMGSVLIMALVMPWDSPALVAADGPFVAVLNLAHLPGVANLMQGVVVVALLSAFNANVYGTSRMIYSLSNRGDGPRALTHVSKRGVPQNAVLVSVFFGVVAVGLNWWLPNDILGILLNAVGASLMVVWIMIVLAQLRMRPKLEAVARETGTPMKMRLRGYPYVTWAVLISLVGVLILMLFDDAARSQVAATSGLVAIILAAYAVTVAVRRQRA